MIEWALVVALAASGTFGASEAGVGTRVGWRAADLLTVEAEFAHYPGDLADRPAFTRARTEALFGATVGPQTGRVRPFARVRPGWLRVHAAPEPLACIAIFPPPLRCVLAGGRTLAAVDAGGGVEIGIGPRSVIRLDAGDRLVRYPAPVFDDDRAVRDEPFFGHDLRVAIGAGLRF